MWRINTREILNALATLDITLQCFDSVSLAGCLKTLLKKKGFTRKELYCYSQNKGLSFTEGAMHKYLREGKDNRRPKQDFIACFAEFLALTPEQHNDLLFILKYERPLRRLETKLIKPFGGKTPVYSSDLKMLCSISEEQSSGGNWSAGVQIQNLEVDENTYTEDELHILFYAALERIVNSVDEANIEDWLIGTGRAISYLLVSTIEEIHLLIAKCIYLWYLLLFLEASYQVSFESLDKNKLPFQRLLFYFLDFFPCKANRRGSSLKIIFFQKEVFQLIPECPLTSVFNNWYDKVSPIAEEIESEYPIEAMMAFTEEGRKITAEFIQSLIKNIGDSDEKLGAVLTKVTQEGFNIDTVRTLQSALNTALKGYKSRLSFQKVDSAE